jgi:hypothetical protein
VRRRREEGRGRREGGRREEGGRRKERRKQGTYLPCRMKQNRVRSGLVVLPNRRKVIVDQGGIKTFPQKWRQPPKPRSPNKVRLDLAFLKMG